MMNSQTKSQFIAVASITSELSAVMVVAKEISLAAANAKAIAFRAGDKAKGFQPITDFINELAKETIELVTKINVHALLLYRLTVDEFSRTAAYNRFEQASKLANATGARYADSMAEPTAHAKNVMQDCQRQFKRDVTQLLGQLKRLCTTRAQLVSLLLTRVLKPHKRVNIYKVCKPLLKVWIKRRIPFTTMCNVVELHSLFTVTVN